MASALLCDLYELTMLDAYLHEEMNETAVFEFFVRRLPKSRSYLVAAGLEQLLDELENLRFTDEEIRWMASTRQFSSKLLEYLKTFRFTGEVRAMSEGTLVFPNEPIVQVIAPLPEAQLIETRLINLIHFQTLIASKAARMVDLAPDKFWVDFGLRRAHGAEAGLLAARAAYLAGFFGTSNLLATRLYGIPSYGTMAHSYVEAHDSEEDAFRKFLETHPQGTTLLIDTYDTEKAAERLAWMIPKLRTRGIRVSGVRIDSGDLAAHAFRVREILDCASLKDIRIFISSSLDEEKISEILRGKAPVDGFGVGSHLTTSSDAPFLDSAYKLQEYAGIARFKTSEGKETYPGRKQVFRVYSATGEIQKDILALEGERFFSAAPLLKTVMKNGRRTAPSPSLQQIRQDLRHKPKGQAKIELSSGLKELTAKTVRRSA